MIESLSWYATRGAGIVSLLLFTGVVVLGILTSTRWQRPGWPRFVTAELHRSVALLSMVFMAIHIVIAVVDPYTALGWASALIPFSVAYRQVWLGLGSVSMYLILAVIVTSLLRARIGARTWRAVHWLTYASWPVALLHGYGTGTDSTTLWMLALQAMCVVAVVAAVLVRVQSAGTMRADLRAALPTR